MTANQDELWFSATAKSFSSKLQSLLRLTRYYDISQDAKKEARVEYDAPHSPIPFLPVPKVPAH